MVVVVNQKDSYAADAVADSGGKFCNVQTRIVIGWTGKQVWMNGGGGKVFLIVVDAVWRVSRMCVL